MADDDAKVTAGTVVRLGRISLLLGLIPRATYHEDGKTPESDTTHTVMLGLICGALAARWYPHLDAGRVAEYALVHDLVEAYAGDTPTLRELSPEQRKAKRDREDEALLRIAQEMGDVLPWVRHRIIQYEDLTSPEARLVKFVDKLLPKITHIFNGLTTVIEQGMSYHELVARYERQGQELAVFAAEFPEVEQLREALVDEVLATAAARYVQCGSCSDVVPYPALPAHEAAQHYIHRRSIAPQPLPTDQEVTRS